MNRRLILILIFVGLVIVVLFGYSYSLVARKVIGYSKAAYYADDLCKAARTGDNAQIESLLKQGANVNARCSGGTDFGKTALIIAIESHKPDTVKFLLDRGANPGIGDDPTDGGNTACYYAATVGDLRSFVYVYKYCDEEAEKKGHLFEAITYNRLDIITYILEHDISPRVTDPNGDTPLHYACSREAVRILLKYGADINEKNNVGETPLHAAHNAEVADELLKQGADRSIRTNAGLSPLDTATRDNRDDVVIVLKQHKT